MIDCGSDAPDHVQAFALSLRGMEHLVALKKLSEHMASISVERRNDFVPYYRKLSNEIDYGFKVGETVQYWYSPHTKRIGKILAIEGSTHLTLVCKLEPEQLNLFGN